MSVKVRDRSSARGLKQLRGGAARTRIKRRSKSAPFDPPMNRAERRHNERCR